MTTTSNKVASNFLTNSVARDYAACLALSDARKAENAMARARCINNPELCAELLSQAQRRGACAIKWPEYFRSIGIGQ